jgi:hypothetical protein
MDLFHLPTDQIPPWYVAPSVPACGLIISALYNNEAYSCVCPEKIDLARKLHYYEQVARLFSLST